MPAVKLERTVINVMLEDGPLGQGQLFLPNVQRKIVRPDISVMERGIRNLVRKEQFLPVGHQDVYHVNQVNILI